MMDYLISMNYYLQKTFSESQNGESVPWNSFTVQRQLFASLCLVYILQNIVISQFSSQIVISDSKSACVSNSTQGMNTVNCIGNVTFKHSKTNVDCAV